MTETKTSWNGLKEKLPERYFINKIEKSRKLRPEVCLIILRDVLDPVLVRNSDPERAELFITKTKKKDATGVETEQEVIRARINGEKFTSAERLTGLNMCRVLDSNGNIISSEYLYNEAAGGLNEGINPDTVTYGVAGVEKGDTFSMKSRVLEGYTYTIEPYNLLNKEQHNALFETGTMMKVGKEGDDEEQGRGLYAHVNIEPPTKMIHFVRVEAPTKEMFLYVLHNILNTVTYFARSTRKGNIRNSILGVIFSEAAIGLSSGELIMEKFNKNNDVVSKGEVITNVKEYVETHKNTLWTINWNDSDEFKKIITPIMDVAMLKNEQDKEVMKECLVELTKQSKAAYLSQEKKDEPEARVKKEKNQPAKEKKAKPKDDEELENNENSPGENEV